MVDDFKYIKPDCLRNSLYQALYGGDKEDGEFTDFILIPRDVVFGINPSALILYGVIVSDFLSGKSTIDYSGRHFVSYKLNDLQKLMNNCSYKSLWKYIHFLNDSKLIQYDFLSKNKGYLFYLIGDSWYQ
ncbi:MAG: hypothetical protein FWC20_00745 [Oscillospiraceae bacterium]|nr:hypothetical protein [Oscillospiraceae bacterium]MCL2277921.1 hypothetical protein [Oscillospiraceae bacterium]